jgi:hypothetical protein
MHVHPSLSLSLSLSLTDDSPPARSSFSQSVNMCDYYINTGDFRFYSSRDEDGAVIRPLPKVKQSLSDPAHLPHIVQLLLTFDPILVSML